MIQIVEAAGGRLMVSEKSLDRVAPDAALSIGQVDGMVVFEIVNDSGAKRRRHDGKEGEI